MVKSGIHPRGMKMFFEKLYKIEREHGVSKNKWISTHPLTTNRIQYLEAKIKKLEHFQEKPLDIDWSKIKKALN